MPCAPGRGRPRNEQTSHLILEAVLDLVAEFGSVQAVSIEAVAATAGVSKATIYRRWSSKNDLIADAIHCMKHSTPEKLPGRSIREDLILLGRGIRSNFSDRDRAVIRVTTLELAHNPKFLGDTHILLDRRRELVRQAFRDAVERGELRDDIDIELSIAMLLSPLVSINIYKVFPELQQDDTVERVVDNLLRVLHA